MLYLESPAGVGFSYSDDKNYTTDDDTVSTYIGSSKRISRYLHVMIQTSPFLYFSKRYDNTTSLPQFSTGKLRFAGVNGQLCRLVGLL